MHRWRTQQTAIRSVNCRIQWIIESLNANGALGSARSTSGAFVLLCAANLRHVLGSRPACQGVPWIDGLRLCPDECTLRKCSSRCDGGQSARASALEIEPQIRRDHPLNLSISISGGRETNKDSLSNGERSGNSSSLKSLAVTARELWPGEAAVPRLMLSKLTWKGTVGMGRYCLRRVGLFGNAAQSGW